MSSPTSRVVTPLKIIGGGSALAHTDGETWMVAGALPQETVRAEIARRRRGIVEAHTSEILENPHPSRLSTPCPDAGSCGGCDWPHVDPGRGAPLKAEVAAEAARTFPELRDRLRQAPVKKSESRYRLRARMHWQPEHKALGFYATRSRKVFPLNRCSIISEGLGEAIADLNEALRQSCPQPADIEWLEDLGGRSRVAALRPSAGGPRIARAWIPDRSAISNHVQGFHRLDGRGELHEGWGETGVVMDLPIPLHVPIGTFFQVNRHLVPWLFERFSEITGRTPRPVWDLHSGVGFLAAAALSAAERPIVAVEPFRRSAEAARSNLPGTTVRVGETAEHYLEGAVSLPREATVILDPPRAGLSPVLRKHLQNWRPQRIVGLACDPATWARDAHELMAVGYDLVHLELIDLFPSTHHVEVLYGLELR